MTAARWLLVRCAGGAPVLGLVDGRRWRGWLVPWFPDRSMEQIGATYYDAADEGEPERAPWQATCGTWDMRDDDEAPVTLERHRRMVTVPAGRGFLALNDSAEMGWCWEEVRRGDVSATEAGAAMLALNDVAADVALVAPKKARKGRKS